MKPTLLTPQFSRSSYLLLAVFILATVLSAITYWQFALFTGSMLVFGQGVLHLIVALLLLVIWIKPSLKWQLLTQFLSSFFIFLLCGLLVNESYIRWMEGGPVLTSAALLTTVLGFGALLLLCHLLTRLSDDNQVFGLSSFQIYPFHSLWHIILDSLSYPSYRLVLVGCGGRFSDGRINGIGVSLLFTGRILEYYGGGNVVNLVFTFQYVVFQALSLVL